MSKSKHGIHTKRTDRPVYKSNTQINKLIAKIEREVKGNNSTAARALKDERDRIAKEFKESENN